MILLHVNLATCQSLWCRQSLCSVFLISSNILTIFLQGIFDLKREAAFNLSLIYQSSGADDLAKHVIQTNIVI